MSFRMAGPVCVEVLEERRLLSAAPVPWGVAEAVAWDLQTPISGEIVGDPAYYKFTATSGEKIVFNSSGMKSIAIVDSDGQMQLDHLFIFDGALNPTPGRLVWQAPHSGTFYITVGHYRGFLIDSQKGPYSLAAYPVQEEIGPQIESGQTINGNFSTAGDIHSYTFDANAGTIYRFELTSEQAPSSGSTAHAVMGVVEAQPWMPAPLQPADALESYPGHNIRFTNLDGQSALGTVAEWVAPASGRYHFSIAPLDAQHLGTYTVVMSQRAFPCDPQSEATTTSQNIQPITSSPAARHRKPKSHHRRPVAHKHAKPSAQGHSNSSTQRSLSLARD